MMSGAETEHGWCILRTAPRSTLSLARTLGEDGFSVWTPSDIVTTAKTRRRPSVEQPVPIMPTFVFAGAVHLPRLAELRMCVTSRHSSFSIFRHAGRIPLIADRALDHLRQREQRAAERRAVAVRRKRVAPAFGQGQKVKVEMTAFAGLEGVVQEQNGEDVLVCFGGRITIKISAWLLNPNDICNAKPIGIAA